MSPVGVDAARALIAGVLTGDVTRESDPGAFEEDMLLFAVRRIERADPAWLLARLTDRTVPFDRRRTVFANTRDLRGQALPILDDERPGFLFEL